MRKHLMTLFLLLMPSIRQRLANNQGTYKDIARLKASLLYLKTIKTFRFLFLSVLGIGVCLVFLVSSIALFNTSLFTYAPYSAETKMWAGFLLAAFYLMIAGIAFSLVFSQEKWLNMFHAQAMIKKIQGEPEIQKEV